MSVKQLAHKTGRIDGSKISDFESELEIAQIQILYITLALYIGTIDLALYRVSTFFCFLRSSLRLVAHNDDNIRRIVLSSRKNIPSNPPDKGYRGVKALANVIQRCGRCFLLPPTFVYKEFTAGSFVALGFPR
ncbi:hypothetical protein J6590_100082 [Homalodisca vitripennis]|nr:hypothetical protein J6590_100082 [Homalodisca vitripennis]